MITVVEDYATDQRQDEAIAVSGLAVFGIEVADLRVNRGEVIALVGANGSGKSTVSRVLVGELAAVGSARVLGLDPVEDATQLKQRVGYLVRDLETMGSLTSRDVLDICAAVRDCTASHAVEMAERIGLDLDRPMSQLSQGQLRRLGVVQALMHRPEVVVLDDPMADLDEHGRRTLAVLLREAAARGTAVLVTAPNPADVQGFADRVATFTERSIPSAPADSGTAPEAEGATETTHLVHRPSTTGRTAHAPQAKPDRSGRRPQRHAPPTRPAETTHQTHPRIDVTARRCGDTHRRGPPRH
jgi:ABC-type multidrug transport system ATPase subunit